MFRPTSMDRISIANVARGLIPAILAADPALISKPSHLSGLAVRMATELHDRIVDLTQTSEEHHMRRHIDDLERTIAYRDEQIRRLKAALRTRAT